MATMTSAERVFAALGHSPADRVPVCLTTLLQGAGELGLPLAEYLSCGEHYAEGQLRLREKFGSDFVVGVPHVVEDLTAFGAGLEYNDGGPPCIDRLVVSSLDAAESLAAPDPLASPALRETLAAIGILAKHVKGEVPILGACIAPFSLPSMLMGADAWMDLLLFQPPDVRARLMAKLLDVTTEFAVRWANLQIEAGADAIVLADGMASGAVITREQFVEWALPVLKQTVAGIRGPIVHEGVGDLSPMLDLLPDTGVAAVILAHTDDLAAAKRLVGDRLTLIGNLNNIEMLRWTPEEAYAKARAAIGAGRNGGGFILGAQGPEIPLGVSDDVLHAIVAAARE